MHRQDGCYRLQYRSRRKDLFALRINYWSTPARWHAVSYYCLISERIIITACMMCARAGPSELTVETSNPSRLGALLSGCYKLSGVRW